MTDRRVFDEYVGGILYRTRVRCAKCEGASDRVQVRRNVELNISPGHRMLRDVYEAHVNETRGHGTRCPVAEAKALDERRVRVCGDKKCYGG